MPPSPSVVGAHITGAVPFDVGIALDFSEIMQTGLTPGDINVELLADGVPTFGTFAHWDSNLIADYRFVVAWPPANATIQLKVIDYNLKNIAGGVCWTSEPIVIVP